MIVVIDYRYYHLAFSKGGISYGESLTFFNLLMVILPIINIVPLFLWIYEYPISGKQFSNKYLEYIFFIKK